MTAVAWLQLWSVVLAYGACAAILVGWTAYLVRVGRMDLWTETFIAERADVAAQEALLFGDERRDDA